MHKCLEVLTFVAKCKVSGGVVSGGVVSKGVAPLSPNSKLKTQNSKLKTQNSKLKTQNSKLFLAKPSQGEETKAALMAMGDRFFLGMGNLCGCHQ